MEMDFYSYMNTMECLSLVNKIGMNECMLRYNWGIMFGIQRIFREFGILNICWCLFCIDEKDETHAISYNNNMYIF